MCGAVSVHGAQKIRLCLPPSPVDGRGGCPLDAARRLSRAAVSGGCCVIAARGLLIAVASLAAEHGLEGVWVSLAVAHQFSRPKACGVFQTGDRTCVLCIAK